MQFTWHEAEFDGKQNLPGQALIQCDNSGDSLMV